MYCRSAGFSVCPHTPQVVQGNTSWSSKRLKRENRPTSEPGIVSSVGVSSSRWPVTYDGLGCQEWSNMVWGKEESILMLSDLERTKRQEGCSHVHNWGVNAMMMTGSRCAVCHVGMEKPRVHYGGVSCYSCRAFFRRTTQREELAKCKFQANCKVDHMERKSCPPCRYDRCLRWVPGRRDLFLCGGLYG